MSFAGAVEVKLVNGNYFGPARGEVRDANLMLCLTEKKKKIKLSLSVWIGWLISTSGRRTEQRWGEV